MMVGAVLVTVRVSLRPASVTGPDRTMALPPPRVTAALLSVTALVRFTGVAAWRVPALSTRAPPTALLAPRVRLAPLRVVVPVREFALFRLRPPAPETVRPPVPVTVPATDVPPLLATKTPSWL